MVDWFLLFRYVIPFVWIPVIAMFIYRSHCAFLNSDIYMFSVLRGELCVHFPNCARLVGKKNPDVVSRLQAILHSSCSYFRH